MKDRRKKEGIKQTERDKVGENQTNRERKKETK
jgi:hypothetical protein